MINFVTHAQRDSTHSKALHLSGIKRIYDCCKQAITKKDLAKIHVVLYYNKCQLFSAYRVLKNPTFTLAFLFFLV
ncbi:hypothetical protein BD560DRAFT_395292 [Blakeslea trispora]|nr:hypothetical protein BD560DRAFT_395292 [Blakeslea trispora]